MLVNYQNHKKMLTGFRCNDFSEQAVEAYKNTSGKVYPMDFYRFSHDINAETYVEMLMRMLWDLKMAKLINRRCRSPEERDYLIGFLTFELSLYLESVSGKVKKERANAFRWMYKSVCYGYDILTVN